MKLINEHKLLPADFIISAKFEQSWPVCYIELIEDSSDRYKSCLQFQAFKRWPAMINVESRNSKDAGDWHGLNTFTMVSCTEFDKGMDELMLKALTGKLSYQSVAPTSVNVIPYPVELSFEDKSRAGLSINKHCKEHHRGVADCDLHGNWLNDPDTYYNHGSSFDEFRQHKPLPFLDEKWC